MSKLILLLTTMFLFSCTENIEQSYKNYQDFIKTSDGNKSWFPDLVSKDCYNIKEIHNIDNNNSFVTFNYRKENKIDSLISCKTTNKITVKEFNTFIKKINNPKRPKWFLKPENTVGLEFFQTKNMIIAKDPATKAVYLVYSSW